MQAVAASMVDFRLALTWLPPADETRRIERWLFDGLARSGVRAFRRHAAHRGHQRIDAEVGASSPGVY